MKPRWLIPICLAAVAIANAEQSRIWTDKKGRTISGEYVEANVQYVTVRLDNGRTVQIDRSTLSADDLAYADKMVGSKPIEVKLEVSRAKFGSSVTETKAKVITSEQWGYEVVLNNQSLQTGKNLRVDYQLYVRTGVVGGVSSTGKLVNRSGSAPIDHIESNGKASIRTSATTLKTDVMQPGWVRSDETGDQDITDRLEGIWVRVYQDNKIITEYVSNEAFRKNGWPITVSGRRGG